MKGRIHWTNIASILVCPLIFESPNYINLEQLKVFKGIETVWSWPISFHFLRDFWAGFLFLFICFGFRGLVKGSGEVKSSSLMSNREALCCFPFWIDACIPTSFLWFVLVNFSGETAVQNERCFTHLVEVGDRELHRNGKKDIFLRSQHQEPRTLFGEFGFWILFFEFVCFLWTSLRRSWNDTLHEVLWNGVWAC